MGVWGSGPFENDLAADISAEWSAAMGEGMTPEYATNALLVAYADSVADPDESPLVWLALCALQLEAGTITSDVRAKTQEVIRSGAALAAWRGDAKSFDERKRAILAIEEQLSREHSVDQQLVPAPVPVRSRSRGATLRWNSGDVVAIEFAAGRHAVLVVVADEGAIVRFRIFRWSGVGCPALADLDGVGFVRPRPGDPPDETLLVAVAIADSGHGDAMPRDRFKFLGSVNLSDRQRRLTPARVVPGERFGGFLAGVL